MILPNFLIIGAYKSGTTSLYRYLRQHPDVFMSPLKEPNFFAHERKLALLQEEGRQQEVIDNIEDYAALFSGVTTERAIGEASPLYLDFPDAAQRIKATLPDVKLIAILRHPVDAFYSDHYMRIRDGRPLEGDVFERFRLLSSRVTAGATTEAPVYYRQLRAYYDLFDSSRLRIYLYEDLKADPVGLMQDLFRFLGVDEGFIPDIGQRHNRGGIPRFRHFDDFLTSMLRRRRLTQNRLLSSAITTIRSFNLRQTPELSPEMRNQFTKVFRNDIENLQELIGRDLSGWLRETVISNSSRAAVNGVVNA